MGTPCSNIDQIKNCCDVMDCVDIHSNDNSVTVTKEEDCGIDLSVTGNNLDNIFQLNNGECITFIKEFVDGKLIITPQIDWNCVAGHVCELCSPTAPDCPAPINMIIGVNSHSSLLINDTDSFLINNTDILIL